MPPRPCQPDSFGQTPKLYNSGFGPQDAIEKKSIIVSPQEESDPGDIESYSGEKDVDTEKQPTQHAVLSEMPAAAITTAQDWNGPHDPENPINWSIAIKAYAVLINAR
ncbi:hypothetical protein LTS18_009091 [Coniosporium uncinatum]|uniref:Uncharacterized protein n=1 Tax=Coniosporium uncinatum TaxID=93489 RepID=A0ACC3DWW7_9PEZI|nr:hypothetical protein LTS18_009091 [Coniosporium uncinatum]